MILLPVTPAVQPPISKTAGVKSFPTFIFYVFL